MKYAFAAVALAGLAAAQIPSCAQPCLDSAVKSATTCAVGSTGAALACQCSAANKAAIQGAAAGCVISACGQDQALAVLSAANALCASAGTATSSSAASSAAATSSSSAAATSSTSASSSATSTTKTSTTAAPTTSAPSNGTVTTSSPPVQVTGAAAQLVAGAGSLFAAGMAVLAAF